MLKTDSKFSFKNLQPVSYLKNFNKMIQHNHRSPLKSNSRRELKTVSLSKFPIPHYYQNMEGIFQTATRKNAQNINTQRNIQQVEQQKFIQKHNDFMRKVLTKFIQHNEQRQNLFEQDKRFVKRQQLFKNHVRTLSQPKNQRKKQKLIDLNPEPIHSGPANATKGSVCSAEDVPKQQTNGVFPELKPRKKKQKFKIRKQSNVEQLLLSRKLNTPAPSSPAQSKKDLNPQKLDFKDDIINLQNTQAQVQKSFTSKIEKQIAKFDKQMDIQVHAIKYYSFWRQENHNYQEKIPVIKNFEDSQEGYAQSKVTIGKQRS